MDRTVDFVVGGTQKGGTTALRDYLLQHPEMYVIPGTESHFFDEDKHFESTEVDYASYHRPFQAAAGQQLIGDKTPTYMYWYSAPKRIWEYNPNMKWILVLRNPIDRAYSHWQMARSRMEPDSDFWSAINNEPIRSRGSLPRQHRRHSFIDRGFYSDQLRRIWFFFPREQTLVLKNEELRYSPVAALNRICRFLGAQPFSSVDTSKPPSSGYAPMARHERQFLAEVFEHEIKEVERLLQWDCSDWLAA